MKIAQIAPLIESVPPRLYGGTERVVSWLTEALVRHGHQVTLFASGDSVTGARLVAGAPRALRLDPEVLDPVAHFSVLMKTVRERADEFDVLHFHTDYFHFPVFSRLAGKTVTTLHGRLDLPDLPAVFRAFPEMPLVSIARHQRQPLRFATWVGNVYHGLPADSLPYCERPSWDYLAFIGRICPEKRVDRAIAIAKHVGMKLKIAAKVDKADREYYEREIQPLLDDPLIEFVGEIGDAEKAEFLGNAFALLFPIDWPEPFGLVMIEAMACGTPVIAYRRGSVPEIVEPGVTGWIADSDEDAYAACRRASMLDRLRVRRRFEERFTAERMMRDYLDLYLRRADAATGPAVAA